MSLLRQQPLCLDTPLFRTSIGLRRAS